MKSKANATDNQTHRLLHGIVNGPDIHISDTYSLISKKENVYNMIDIGRHGIRSTVPNFPVLDWKVVPQNSYFSFDSKSG